MFDSNFEGERSLHTAEMQGGSDPRYGVPVWAKPGQGGEKGECVVGLAESEESLGE